MPAPSSRRCTSCRRSTTAEPERKKGSRGSPFALITLVEDLHECSSSSFKRLHDGLNLKAFKTSEGFISLKAGIAMLGLDSGALPLGIDELLQRTEALLPDAYASGRIATCRLPALR